MQDKIYNKNPLSGSSFLNDTIDSKLDSELDFKSHTANIIVTNKRSLPEDDDVYDVNNQDVQNCKTNKKQKRTFSINIESNSLDQSNDDGIINCETNEGSPKSKRKCEWNFQNVLKNCEPFSSDLFFFGSENCDITNSSNEEDVHILAKDENDDTMLKYNENDVSAINNNSDTTGKRNSSKLLSADLGDPFSSKMFFFGSEIDTNKENRTSNIPFKVHNEITTQSIKVGWMPKTNDSKSKTNGEINNLLLEKSGNIKDETVFENKNTPFRNMDNSFESNTNGKKNQKNHENSDIVEDETMLEYEKNTSYLNMDKSFERSWIDQSGCVPLESSVSTVYKLEHCLEDIVESQACENSNTNGEKNQKNHENSDIVWDETMLEYEKNTSYLNMDKSFESNTNGEKNKKIHENSDIVWDETMLEYEKNTSYLNMDKSFERSWIDQSGCVPLESSVSTVYKLEHYPENIVESQACENSNTNGEKNKKIHENSDIVGDETMLEYEKNTSYLNMDKSFERNCIVQFGCVPLESSVNTVYNLEHYPEDIVESQTCENRCNLSIVDAGTNQQNHSFESSGLEKLSVVDFHKKSSPVHSDVEQNSHDSQSSDDLFWLLPPSMKHIKNVSNDSKKNVKLIQDKSYDTIHNEEIVTQSESCLKSTEKYELIPVNPMPDRSDFHDIKNFVKDSEDKVKYFYDCDLSSIGGDVSYLEDDSLLSLSYEIDSSLDNSDSNKESRSLNSPNNIHNETTKSFKLNGNMKPKTNNGKILERCNMIIDDTGTGQKNHSLEFSGLEKHSTSDLRKKLSPVTSCDVEQDCHKSSSSDDLFWLLPPKMTRGSSDIDEKIMKLTQNKSHKTIHNDEIVSQSEPCLKFSEESQFIVNPMHDKTDLPDFKSSSFVKDSEDNVDYFYNCDISIIEDSYVEADLLLSLSYKNDSSLDNSLFNEESESITICDQDGSIACHKKPQIQKSKSSSIKNCLPAIIVKNNSCVSNSNIENNSLFVHASYDHKYTEVTAREFSKEDIQLDTTKVSTSGKYVQQLMSDKIDKEFSVDMPNGKSSKDNSIMKSYSNKITLPYVESHAEKSAIYHESENSNSKTIKNCAVSDIDNKMDATDIKPCKSVMDKESCLDKTDKKPSINGYDFEDDILPHLSECLAKSTNSQSILKKALACKASTNINVKTMGDQALNTYLTQQSLTTSVLKVMYNSLETCPSSGILLEDPKGLVVPLMPHQKHAIAWLMWREQQEPKGGILADDMGLGKTLSMISLVLKSKTVKQNSGPVVSTKDDIANGGTLVVCPASLISQWENEVRTKLNPNLLKVRQYYGINRSTSVKDLISNDIVITSYHMVMWDYKKLKKSSPLFKIKWDRIILDEAHCIRNHKTQTSIAVCNMSSRNRWVLSGTPIQNREADFFTLLKFIGCQPFDEWVVWKRWVSNNDELGKHRLALFVKALMLRRTKQDLSEFTTFKLPSKNFHTIDIELSKEERNAYEKLLQFSSHMFATCLYERATKEKVLNSSFEVPCKVQYFQEKTDEKEKVFEDHPELLKLFREFKNIKDLQTHHILVLLLRLRQICCHPCLIKGPLNEETFSVESIKEEKVLMEDFSNTYIDETANNPLFENTTSDPTSNSTTVLAMNSTTAPASDPNVTENLTILMSRLTLNEEPTLIDSNMIFEKSWPSTKVKIVSDYVWEKVLKNNGKDKAIIVSQWPSMLFIIRQYLLTRYGAKMEMYAGYVPILKRNKIIQEFNDTNGGPQILLLSLTAGGVGLNLMVANHMFLVDVHWNPQLEAQACDRIFRVGQTKPVNIYKFVCTNTIETRILMIQARKLQIAENLFNGVGVTSLKITVDDLKQIFQMK